MAACAVARLTRVTAGPAIVAYLSAIDATLAPFAGRFLVHGGTKTVLEGDRPGGLVVIGFPDRARAEAWYGSAPYRAILPFRTAHAKGDFVDGVGDDHVATDALAG